MLGTQDILFIVLAFCALWFTIFLCWLMYQIAMLVKRLHNLVDDVKAKLNELVEEIAGMKRKFDGNVALISGIAEGIKRIMEALKGRSGGGSSYKDRGGDGEI